jgi:hypothetical protein
LTFKLLPFRARERGYARVWMHVALASRRKVHSPSVNNHHVWDGRGPIRSEVRDTKPSIDATAVPLRCVEGGPPHRFVALVFHPRSVKPQQIWLVSSHNLLQLRCCKVAKPRKSLPVQEENKQTKVSKQQMRNTSVTTTVRAHELYEFLRKTRQ